MNVFMLWKRFFSLFLYPLKSLSAFFLFMYALGIMCSWIEVPLPGDPPAYANRYIELFLDLYAICFILCLIPYKVRRWVTLSLYVIFYAVAIADVYCYFRFDSTLTPTMLQLALETNSEEASEFIDSYLSFDILFSPLGWIFLVMAVHVLYACRKMIVRRLPPKVSAMLIAASRRTDNVASAAEPCLGILALALIITSAISCYQNKNQLYKLMSQKRADEMERMWNKRYGDGLYLPIYRLAFSLYANNLTVKQIDNLVGKIDQVRVDSCTFRSPNIILIIGESYNRHHSQLYGYKKKTTPRQARLARAGSLTAFKDVISPWNLTSNVFKNAFSMHAIGDQGSWSDYPLFTEIFRKAGYHVTFITNQFVQNPDEAPADFSGGYFLNNKLLSAAQFDSRNTISHPYDEDLLADYDSLKKENREHNLIIFHLMGQHVGYHSRYPKDRAHFDIDDYDRPDLNNDEKKILCAYDNATLYNDSVVYAIIKKFQKTDAIVIYMPDHAEEVFDDIHVFGRMHSAKLTARMVRQEFEIPFWIWCSRSYIHHHLDIYRQIITSCNRPFMSDNISQLLIYLAGISCPEYKPEYNLLSPLFDEDRPRLLKGIVNYDTLMNDKKDLHDERQFD